MKKLTSLLIVSAFSVVAANGCTSTTDPGEDVIPDVTQPEKAQLRVIHLSPDAPAVDMFANEAETAAVNELAFQEGTAYLDFIPGTWNFDLAPAGQGIAASVLDTGALELEGGKSYTAVAYDRLSSLKVMAIVDDYEDLGAGDIRVRAIHAAAGVGQVDIWNIPATGDPSTLYSDVDFGAVGAYKDLPAGAYKLGFDVDNDATPDLTFQTPDLAAGTVINLFAVKQNDKVFLIAQVNDGSILKIEADEVVVVTDKTRLRAIHLSQDAPNVDIFANEGESAVVGDLAFLEGTPYLELDAGTYNFDLAPAGSGISASVLDTGALELEKDKSYTAVAFNYVAYLKVIALVDDYADLDAGKIRVRPIHAAPAVGMVDIWNIPAEGEPTALYTDVDFEEVGGYTDLPAGAYKLGFDANDDGMPDLFFQTPELAAGTVINLFAVSEGADVFLIAQTNDGTVARIDPVLMPRALIRAIHLSPDAPHVDIFANEAEPAIVTHLAFPNTTSYLEVAPGTYNFDLAPADAGLAASVLDTGNLELEDGKYYTAVAYDEVANLKVLPLVDDYANLDAGKVRIRPIHVAAGIGQVDIWNTPEVGEPTMLYEDVEFGTAGAFMDLPADDYRLGFDINDDGLIEAYFHTPELPAGEVINLFAVVDGVEVFLIAQTDDGNTARIDAELSPRSYVRAIHLSPDAPAVDIFANENATPVVVELAFQDGTGYLELEPGSYNFDVAPTGDGLGASVLDTGVMELENLKNYTAVAYDVTSSLKGLIMVDDFTGLAAGDVRVRAIHTAAGVGQVDVWRIPDAGESVLLWEDVNFGAVGEYIDVPAGTYKLGIDANNDAVPEFIFVTPDLAAGTVANVFAVSDGPDVFLLAQLENGFVGRMNPLVP